MFIVNVTNLWTHLWLQDSKQEYCKSFVTTGDAGRWPHIETHFPEKRKMRYFRRELEIFQLCLGIGSLGAGNFRYPSRNLFLRLSYPESLSWWLHVEQGKDNKNCWIARIDFLQWNKVDITTTNFEYLRLTETYRLLAAVCLTV